MSVRPVFVATINTWQRNDVAIAFSHKEILEVVSRWCPPYYGVSRKGEHQFGEPHPVDDPRFWERVDTGYEDDRWKGLNVFKVNPDAFESVCLNGVPLSETLC